MSYNFRYRFFWSLVLVLGVCLLFSACATPGQTAGLGAAVSAGFDGLLGVLRASNKIDDATQVAMSQAFHQATADGAKAVDGLRQLWDQFQANKDQVAGRFVQVVETARDACTAIAAKIPSTGEVIALGTTGGGSAGTAVTQLIRGPREATRQKMAGAKA